MFGVVGRIFAAFAVVAGLTGHRVRASFPSSPFDNIPYEQQLQIARELERNSKPYGHKGYIREQPRPEIEPLTDCMFSTSEARHFRIESVDSSDTVCGIYIFTEPDELVEISFPRVDVPCGGQDIIGVVDGWELNGQIFPPDVDHPLSLEQRSTEFCGRKMDKVFLSSQNNALVQYRIPTVGKGFTVSIKFRKNRFPCNVVSSNEVDVFTLRNYGRRVNCTFMTIYPAAIRTIALDVGSKRVRGSVFPGREETGTIHQCDKHGAGDEVQMGGTDGLDTSQLETLDTMCGLDSKASRITQIIGCEVTSVRLVSSGNYDNSITIASRPASKKELYDPDLTCGLNSIKPSE